MFRDPIGYRIKTLSNMMKRNMECQFGPRNDRATLMQGWIIGFLSDREEKGLETFQKDIEEDENSHPPLGQIPVYKNKVIDIEHYHERQRYEQETHILLPGHERSVRGYLEHRREYHYGPHHSMYQPPCIFSLP